METERWEFSLLLKDRSQEQKSPKENPGVDAEVPEQFYILEQGI